MYGTKRSYSMGGRLKWVILILLSGQLPLRIHRNHTLWRESTAVSEDVSGAIPVSLAALDHLQPLLPILRCKAFLGGRLPRGSERGFLRVAACLSLLTVSRDLSGAEPTLPVM